MQTTGPSLKKSAQKRKSGFMKMQRVGDNRSLWFLVRNVNLVAQNKQEEVRRSYSAAESTANLLSYGFTSSKELKVGAFRTQHKGKYFFLLLQIYLPLHLMLPIRNCSLNKLQGPMLSSTSDYFSLSHCSLRAISFNCFPGSFSVPAWLQQLRPLQIPPLPGSRQLKRCCLNPLQTIQLMLKNCCSGVLN